MTVMSRFSDLWSGAVARRWVRIIRRSGLFDREYYETITRTAFAREDLAIRHFVESDPLRGYSFHVLIEPSWLYDLSGPGGLPWYRRFFRERGVRATGPLFDPTHLLSSSQAHRRTTAKAMRVFFARASKTTILPHGLPRAVTWGEARDALLTLAREFVVQDSRSTRRNPRDWDAPAEREMLQGLQASVPDDPPLISIVMPTYNRACLVERAIRSVIAQSYRAWELIVVDDGSVDGTRAVVSAMSLVDDRISVVARPHSGVSAARNVGIESARGRYVAFLDSDNEWTTEFLTASVSSLIANGASGSYSAVEVRLDDERREYLGGPAMRDDLLDGRNMVDLNALVIERAVLIEVGMFDTAIRRWVDFDLVLRVLRSHDLAYLPMIGVIYDHRASAVDRITTSESDRWREVVLEKSLVDWDRQDRELGERVPARTSLLIRNHRQWRQTLATIEMALGDAAGRDIEVIVIDNASPREECAILKARSLGDPRFRVRRVATDLRTPASTNLAFTLSTGGTVVVIAPGAILGADRASGDGAPMVVPAVTFVEHRGLDPLTEMDDEGRDVLRLRPADGPAV